jgi:hypothetical protein
MLANLFFRREPAWKLSSACAQGDIVKTFFRIGYFVLCLVTFYFEQNCWAEEISCPISIKVDEKITDIPSSWEPVINPQGHHLDNVALYYGHPKEMASLVPDQETKDKAIWRFPNKESEKYWLACNYSGTEIMLVKQLPHGLSQCEVTYNLSDSGQLLSIKSVIGK